MTLTTNARLAGFTFLFYIAAGVADMVLLGQALSGDGTAAKLANIAQHAPIMGIVIVMRLMTFVSAVVLAVTLYALTRDEDREVALLALCFRVCEGVVGVVSVVRTAALLAIATAAAGVSASQVAAADVLLRMGSFGLVAATCFAMGSTLYAYLFLRARSIPVLLAWLGVASSVLLLLVLPAQLAGLATGPVTSLVWIPMLVFEVALAFWLIFKGVAVGPSSEVG